MRAEPTSALDPETTTKVEATLLSFLPDRSSGARSPSRRRNSAGGPKAYVLITHNDEQAERLAGRGARVVDLSSGTPSRAPSEAGGRE